MAAGRSLIRDIEILRAIAVLGVICQHLNGNLVPRIGLGEPFGILVWFCSGSQDMLAGRGTATRMMLWAGRRSYAMYLIHIPVMYSLRETAYRLELELADQPFVSCVLALVLIGALAEANYRWVETPLRRRGRRLAERLGRDRARE